MVAKVCAGRPTLKMIKTFSRKTATDMKKKDIPAKIKGNAESEVTQCG